jgi:hypothetical protein
MQQRSPARIELLGMTEQQERINGTYFTALELVRRWRDGKANKHDVAEAVSRADDDIKEHLVKWIDYHRARVRRGEKL